MSTPTAGQRGSESESQKTAPGREAGTVIVLAVLILGLLAALAASFGSVLLKNARQATFYNRRFELRRYAETGIDLALYELKNSVNGSDGNIGTESWVTANDVGKDGKSSTKDDGEGNGIPGPGEPNTTPATVGPTSLGIKLLVRTSDTAWSGIKRIDACAWDKDAISNVQCYCQAQPASGSALGAAYIEGGVKWGLSGTSSIRGFDTDPPTTLTGLDGPAGPKPAIPAVATSIGYETTFQTQLASRAAYFTGLQDDAAGTASVEQFVKPDFDTLYNQFKGKAGVVTVATGSHSSVNWGNWTTNNYQITYCPGNLSISSGYVSGVLLVDGTLTINGPARFVGLVMVKSSVVYTGGSGGKTYGALWSKAPIDFKMSGDAMITYSSKGLAAAYGLSGNTGSYSILHWAYPK